MVNIYIPFPGTEIFDDLISDDTIKLGDELFDGMGLAWDVLSTKRKTVCKGINNAELKFYRFCFSITFNLLSNLCRPWRFIMNLLNIETEPILPKDSIHPLPPIPPHGPVTKK